MKLCKKDFSVKLCAKSNVQFKLLDNWDLTVKKYYYLLLLLLITITDYFCNT